MLQAVKDIAVQIETTERQLAYSWDLADVVLSEVKIVFDAAIVKL